MIVLSLPKEKEPNAEGIPLNSTYDSCGRELSEVETHKLR